MGILAEELNQPFERHPIESELYGAPIPGSLHRHENYVNGWEYWHIREVEVATIGGHAGIFVMIDCPAGHIAQGVAADCGEHAVLCAVIDAIDIAGKLARDGELGGLAPPTYVFDDLADLVAGVSV